mmetsp:Transcript_41183/g.97617  ORF Transcript_41183/g.97617 Transcript_41183/m.97617 type:complete len:1009 (-) Transcript_41183:4042-7068(-)
MEARRELHRRAVHGLRGVKALVVHHEHAIDPHVRAVVGVGREGVRAGAPDEDEAAPVHHNPALGEVCDGRGQRRLVGEVDGEADALLRHRLAVLNCRVAEIVGHVRDVLAVHVGVGHVRLREALDKLHAPHAPLLLAALLPGTALPCAPTVLALLPLAVLPGTLLARTLLARALLARALLARALLARALLTGGVTGGTSIAGGGGVHGEDGGVGVVARAHVRVLPLARAVHEPRVVLGAGHTRLAPPAEAVARGLGLGPLGHGEGVGRGVEEEEVAVGPPVRERDLPQPRPKHLRPERLQGHGPLGLVLEGEDVAAPRGAARLGGREGRGLHRRREAPSVDPPVAAPLLQRGREADADVGEGVGAAHPRVDVVARAPVVPGRARLVGEHRDRLVALGLHRVPRREVHLRAILPDEGRAGVGPAEPDVALRELALGARDGCLGVRVHARQHAPLRRAARRHLLVGPGRHREPAVRRGEHAASGGPAAARQRWAQRGVRREGRLGAEAYAVEHVAARAPLVPASPAVGGEHHLGPVGLGLPRVPRRVVERRGIGPEKGAGWVVALEADVAVGVPAGRRHLLGLLAAVHRRQVAAPRQARAPHCVPRAGVHHEEVVGVGVPRGDVVHGRELGGVERHVRERFDARERLEPLARAVRHGGVVGGGHHARVAAPAHAPPVRLVRAPLALREEVIRAVVEDEVRRRRPVGEGHLREPDPELLGAEEVGGDVPLSLRREGEHRAPPLLAALLGAQVVVGRHRGREAAPVDLREAVGVRAGHHRGRLTPEVGRRADLRVDVPRVGAVLRPRVPDGVVGRVVEHEVAVLLHDKAHGRRALPARRRRPQHRARAVVEHQVVVGLHGERVGRRALPAGASVEGGLVAVVHHEVPVRLHLETVAPVRRAQRVPVAHLRSHALRRGEHRVAPTRGVARVEIVVHHEEARLAVALGGRHGARGRVGAGRALPARDLVVGPRDEEEPCEALARGGAVRGHEGPSEAPRVERGVVRAVVVRVAA